MPYKKNTQATYTPSMSGTLRTIKEYAPLFIQIGTVLALLLAAYIASTLRPLYEDIRSLATKVQAIEESRKESATYVPRFIVTEQKVNDQTDDIQEIKADVKDIRTYLLGSK